MIVMYLITQEDTAATLLDRSSVSSVSPSVWSGPARWMIALE